MTILGLSGIDWIILGILAAFALIGFHRGLLRELFTLVGVFASLVIGFLLMEPAGRLIGRWISLSERFQLILGFLSIFIVCFILLHLFFLFFSRVLRFTPIGVGDRIAGLCFGLFKGSFVVFVLLFFVGLLPLNSFVSRHFHTSFFMRSIRGFSPKIETVIAALPKARKVLETKKRQIIILKNSKIRNQKSPGEIGRTAPSQKK